MEIEAKIHIIKESWKDYFFYGFPTGLREFPVAFVDESVWHIDDNKLGDDTLPGMWTGISKYGRFRT